MGDGRKSEDMVVHEWDVVLHEIAERSLGLAHAGLHIAFKDELG